MEVRSELAPILNRRCVFVKWEDLTSDKFDSLLERGTGALIVVLPRSLANISSEEKLEWMELERVLLLQDIKIPLYFVTETDELLEVMDNVNDEVTDSSGLSVLSGEWISSVAQHMCYMHYMCHMCYIHYNTCITCVRRVARNLFYCVCVCCVCVCVCVSHK